MQSMKKFALLLISALSLAACNTTEEKAPDYINSEERPLELVGNKKLTLIHFWSDDCSECDKDRLLLASFMEDFPQFNVVSVYTGDDEKGAEAKWKSVGEPYTLIKDTDDLMEMGYEVVTLPTTLYLNTPGLVISRTDGPLQEAELYVRAQEVIEMESFGM
jgi:thiol-disulfide isomerase/thioredoxin